MVNWELILNKLDGIRRQNLLRIVSSILMNEQINYFWGNYNFWVSSEARVKVTTASKDVESVVDEFLQTFRTDWTLKPRRRRRFLTLWTSCEWKFWIVSRVNKLFQLFTSRDSKWGFRVRIIVKIWLFGSVSQNVNTKWFPTAFITWTVPVNWL